MNTKKSISIYTLADLLGADIELIRFNNQNERWVANFKNCETKDSKTSNILCGTYGDADDPIGAIVDYCNKIQGKVLVFNPAKKDKRTEFVAPMKIII